MMNHSHNELCNYCVVYIDIAIHQLLKWSREGFFFFFFFFLDFGLDLWPRTIMTINNLEEYSKSNMLWDHHLNTHHIQDYIVLDR